MNQYPLWKYILLAFMIVLGVVYTLPNLYGEDYAVQISKQDSQTIGSDVADNVKKLLNEHEVPFMSVNSEDGQVLVRFENTDTQLKATDLIKAKLGDDYIIAPNLASNTPKWLEALGAEPLKLGLDLRGGVHFLLGVNTEQVIQNREQGDMHGMGTELREENIRYQSVRRAKEGGVVIRFRDIDTLNQANKVLPQQFPDYLFTEFTQSPQMELRANLTEAAITKIQNEAIEQSMRVLRKRIDELHIQEAIVQRQGVNKISVDLPGVQDTTRAKDIIGKTATLEFHMVADDQDPIAAQSSGVVPLGTKMYTHQGAPILLKSQIILKGEAITSAMAERGDQGPQVSIRLGGGGGESLFHRVTAKSIGKSMAVVYVEYKTEKKLVDGEVVSVPKKQEKIISVATIQAALGNSFRITGLRSMQYSNDLALLLRSGSFNAPINFLQERIVGPSLGKANIEKGMLSLQVGMLIVVIFMMLYYRLFGLFANLALVLNLVFIIAILSFYGGTLTLAGIAGLVLTVGMAVDANVLINERIREELRNGMSPQASIKAGYERALSTIIDANVTTLIVCVVLMAVGNSNVKSFAVTLTIGLLTSMVTAIFFTRACVNLVYGGKQVKTLSIGRSDGRVRAVNGNATGGSHGVL